MAAYVSEISITGDSPQEFIELAVTEGTDTGRYSIVHYDGIGIVYLTYSFGTIESTTNGFDVCTIDDSDPDFPVITDNGSGGTSYYKQSSPNKDTLPCFEASTHILTHEGYRLASSMRLGNLVKTVDHGYQPIR